MSEISLPKAGFLQTVLDVFAEFLRQANKVFSPILYSRYGFIYTKYNIII